MSIKDLALTADGELAEFTGGGEWITGKARVAQELRIRFNTHFGEYFLDSRMGVPWVEWLEGKATTTMLQRVKSWITKEVLATTGVKRLDGSVKVTWNSGSRSIGISFRCITVEEGEPLSVSGDYMNLGAIKLLIIDSTGGVL